MKNTTTIKRFTTKNNNLLTCIKNIQFVITVTCTNEKESSKLFYKVINDSDYGKILLPISDHFSKVK